MDGEAMFPAMRDHPGDPVADTAWLSNADLDAESRAYLSAFLTARRGIDGQLYWPADELRLTDA